MIANPARRLAGIKILKLLPFQGDLADCIFNPGCCPGLGASALSGRMASRRNCKSGETPSGLPHLRKFCPLLLRNNLEDFG